MDLMPKNWRRGTVTLFCIAESKAEQGEPINAEPDQCEGWHWFGCDQLPQPLFQPLEDLKEKVGDIKDVIGIFGMTDNKNMFLKTVLTPR